jgi:hypothetical protein
MGKIMTVYTTGDDGSAGVVIQLPHWHRNTGKGHTPAIRQALDIQKRVHEDLREDALHLQMEMKKLMQLFYKLHMEIIRHNQDVDDFQADLEKVETALEYIQKQLKLDEIKHGYPAAEQTYKLVFLTKFIEFLKLLNE